MKKIIVLVLIVVIFYFLFVGFKTNALQQKATWWNFQSIDTMKYSRDLSRQKLKDPSFDGVIDQQDRNIAAAGATHVAIATPYDEEFYPILSRWVAAARKYNLKVWFRGNFSGWEGWFDYPKITRAEHLKKTADFITKHKDLFMDGDVFTACPECENGGTDAGDPRQTGDIEGFRKFMIDEYSVTRAQFVGINKNVASNFDSMNADVAKVVMDRDTTNALDGVVAIDHYVTTPEKLVSDIKSISNTSGGKIVLGEFGAPIPDINGQMNDKEQASWIKDALASLVKEKEVIGVNYWTNTGGSTALWRDDGTPKDAVSAVQSVYLPSLAFGSLKDGAGGSIENADMQIGNKHFFTDKNGNYSFPFFTPFQTAKIRAVGFKEMTISIRPGNNKTMVLKLENEDFIFKIRKFIFSVFNR